MKEQHYGALATIGFAVMAYFLAATAPNDHTLLYAFHVAGMAACGILFLFMAVMTIVTVMINLESQSRKTTPQTQCPAWLTPQKAAPRRRPNAAKRRTPT